jgi:exopolysaccharide biosynthesis polyprenyl glycosylphosphotransferase
MDFKAGARLQEGKTIMKMKEKKRESFQAESDLSLAIPNHSRPYPVDYSEIFHNSFFIDQLRLEKLRAQRAKSRLSIILLTLDQEKKDQFIDRMALLNTVRAKTRATDICGWVSEKTLGILLPDTDEKGAKEICEKLTHEHQDLPFLFTLSTYPDHIFESLAKDGCIRPDAFPFALEEVRGPSWVELSLKRGLDISGSIIGILVFMPVMLLTALAVKATSPGPVIFRQARLGKQGIPFMFYKFRSMYTNMDDRIHREYIRDLIDGNHEKVNQGNGDEPFFKIKSDPRITPVGRFIRKTSIDELPQFFNVLKGDMSLVGPRPPLAYEAEKYQAWHLRRILEMKPGITGLWQVEGRSKTDWDDTVRLDIRYIQNWSLLFDLRLLIRTVGEVLRGRGAV